jgi:hypothetical protein
LSTTEQWIKELDQEPGFMAQIFRESFSTRRLTVIFQSPHVLASDYGTFTIPRLQAGNQLGSFLLAGL